MIVGPDGVGAARRRRRLADRERPARDREGADAGSAAVRSNIERHGAGTCPVCPREDRDPRRPARCRPCTTGCTTDGYGYRASKGTDRLVRPLQREHTVRWGCRAGRLSQRNRLASNAKRGASRFAPIGGHSKADTAGPRAARARDRNPANVHAGLPGATRERGDRDGDCSSGGIDSGRDRRDFESAGRGLLLDRNLLAVDRDVALPHRASRVGDGLKFDPAAALTGRRRETGDPWRVRRSGPTAFRLRRHRDGTLTARGIDRVRSRLQRHLTFHRRWPRRCARLGLAPNGRECQTQYE